MTGRAIPRRTLRPEHVSRLRLGCALALLATLGTTASAALAEPAAEASAFASAFADIGPAQTAVLPQPHAVDVTEVLPGAPTEATGTPTAPQGELTGTPIGTPIGSGMASYYGRELAGRRTASGEVFDPAQMTAAHRTLPFGSLVRVTSTRTGRSVVVRINDRGPFTRGRLIDLSQGAAEQIDLVRTGHAPVSIELLQG